MPTLPYRTKKLLQRVVAKKISKVEASKVLGISRKTLYQWLSSYGKYPSFYTKDKRAIEKFILRIAVTHPELGPRAIASILEKNKLNLSETAVWLKLKKLNLHQKYLREAASLNYKKTKLSHTHDLPVHLRLNPEPRKRMIEAYLSGERQSDVLKKFNVSRKTFCKWKSRYLKAKLEELNIIDSLKDANPIGIQHKRSIRPEIINLILAQVRLNPQLSTKSLAAKLGIVGNHGVQRVLERAGLSRYEMRLAYKAQQDQRESLVPQRVAKSSDSIRSIWEKFIPNLAPAPPPSFLPVVKFFSISLFASFLILFASLTWISVFVHAGSPGASLGIIFATIALTAGSIFFLYSLKYYLSMAIVLSFSQKEGLEVSVEGGEAKESKSKFKKGILGRLLSFVNSSTTKQEVNPIGLKPNLDNITLNRSPFISIHIPFFNEKNVVERSIKASLNFDYPTYEVILCDDSTDETTTIIQNYQSKYLFKGEDLSQHTIINEQEGWSLTTVETRRGVFLKHLHRTTRSGFKGGALQLALKVSDPKTEFVSVFDADFVPYPDTLTLFLKYFKAQNGGSEDYTLSKVAGVQGYQWHVLNKSENWITRGVRSEYAGSYVIERSGEELYQGLKQISGSVYMLRKEPLQQVGWGTSITEDFELTLKLYERGYKVVYTPYIQAPAECVSTIKSLLRQRMRWAEGHSNNIKQRFGILMRSSNLSLPEKLEFLYLSPYYLQAFFFIVGTLSWFISEVILGSHLPFWTSLWGWSLVLTNLIALPLMNGVGMFLEESEERDYIGLASFVTLSYLLVPFQAYSSLKGFLEKEEGPWFRTPKTGHITDIFTPRIFYRLVQGILPRKVQEPLKDTISSYLKLSSGNNRFEDFRITKSKKGYLGKVVLAILLCITTTLYSLTHNVSLVKATNMTGPLKLGIGAVEGTAPAWANYMQNTSTYSSGTTFLFHNVNALGTGTNNYAWYTNLLPTGAADGSIPSGAYYLQIAKMNGGGAGTNIINFGVQLLLTNNNGTDRTQLLGNVFQIQTSNANNTLFQYSIGSLGSAQAVTQANPNRLSLRIYWINGTRTSTNVNWVINNTTVPARLVIPADITVPEIPQKVIYIILLTVMPFIPGIAARLEKRDKRKRRGLKGWIKDFESMFDTITGRNEALTDELPV